MIDTYWDEGSQIYTVSAKAYEQLEQENAELKAQVNALRDELLDAAGQYMCGCGHPACNNCHRDKEYEETLNKTQQQCLAAHDAAVIEKAIYSVDSNNDSQDQTIRALENYAQQLKEKSK